MRVCIPASDEKGLESATFGHFGSALYFVVHDTETASTQVLRNENPHHGHGGCQPLSALGDRSLDALIVGGIGRRAIARLNASGTKVYCAAEGTIAENVARLQRGELAEFTLESACAGHGA